MLKALSPSSSSIAAPPNLLDRRIGSSRVKYKFINGSDKDPLASRKPKTLLSTSCLELDCSSSTVPPRSVQIHLTSYREILVLSRPGDDSYSKTALRRHHLDTDQIKKHSTIPKALLVEESRCDSATPKCYIYQVENSKTLNEWLNKVAVCKKDAGEEEQLRKSAMNGSAKHLESCNNCSSADMGEGNVEENQLSPHHQHYVLSNYVHGPGSPVMRNIDPSLIPPSKSSGKTIKSKKRIFEKFGIGNGIPVVGLFRRNTESKIIQLPEKHDNVQNHSTTFTTSLPNKFDVNADGICSYARLEQSVCEAGGDEADDDRGERCVMSDVSDVVSDSYSGCSSRCSSTRSSGRQGLTNSSNVVNYTAPIRNVRHNPMCSCADSMATTCLQYGCVCNKITTADENKRHFVRRASHQLKGLLWRSFDDRKKRRGRGRVYVRDCRSTSDLDHMIYDGQTANQSIPCSSCTSTQHNSLSSPEATPTCHTKHNPYVATSTPEEIISPTLSQNSESDSKDEFVVSKFHHTQIRNHRLKRSPRFLPHGEHARLQRTASYQHQAQQDVVKNGSVTIREQRGRSFSISPTLQCNPDLPRNSSRTSSRKRKGGGDRGRFANGSAVNACVTLPRVTTSCLSPPLPRRYTSSDRRRTSSGLAAGGLFSPSSPSPRLNGSKSSGTNKSPMILRIFNRRHTQSASMGKILDMKAEFYPMTISSAGHVAPGDSDCTFSWRLHQFSAKGVAQELCRLDSVLLRKICPKELKDAAWTKKNKESVSPNVLKMVRAFNQLALLVPTEILAETTPNARAKVIVAYIQIARHCYSLHNYNSLKAVLAGLQCSPIYRLEKTWKEVSSRKKKHYHQLCELMSEQDNWKRYRAKIQRCLLDNTPFIPFLGLFLTQIIQMNSYHNIKDLSGGKAREDLSQSCSEEKNDSVLFDPVALKAQRRHSSFGDSIFCPFTPPYNGCTHPDHSPTFAHDAPSTNGASKTANYRFSYTVQPSSDNDDPLSKRTPLQSTPSSQLAENHLRHQSMDDLLNLTPSESGNILTSQSSNGSDSDCIHVAVPTYFHIHRPEKEISNMTTKNTTPLDSNDTDNNHINVTNDETDDGFDTGDRNEKADQEHEGLSLDDISFSLKRRSRSVESMLKDYGVSVILKRGDGYHSLGESEEEEEERDDRYAFFLDNTCSGLSDGPSDLDLLNSSLTYSHINSTEQESGMEILSNAAACSNAALTKTSCVVQRSVARQVQLSTSLDSSSCRRTSCADTSMATHISSEAGRSTKVNRGKSPNSKRLARMNNFLRKPKSFSVSQIKGDAVTSDYPDSMLKRLQAASSGYDHGVWPCAAVRRVLCERVTNTELDNYKLSLKRES